VWDYVEIGRAQAAARSRQRQRSHRGARDHRQDPPPAPRHAADL